MARRRYQRGSVELRGRMWYARYYRDFVEDGVLKRKQLRIRLGPKEAFATKRLAMRALEARLAEVNSPLAVAQQAVRFEQFVAQWNEAVYPTLRSSTACSYRSVIQRHLLPAFTGVYLHDVTPQFVQQFVTRLDASPKTVFNVFMVLRSLWRVAESWNYVSHNPCMRIQLPPRAVRGPRFFWDVETLRRIILAAEEPYRTLYWLAAETGLRAGEICGLQWCDVDVDGCFVSVRQSVWHNQIQIPKTGRSIRVVGISRQLAEHLRHLRERSAGGPLRFVFADNAGAPLDSGVIVKQHLQPLLARLGLPRAGLHAFRHAHASIAHRVGVPLRVVQDRLGHTNSQITLDVYTHAATADEQRFVAWLGDSLMGGSVCEPASLVQ